MNRRFAIRFIIALVLAGGRVRRHRRLQHLPRPRDPAVFRHHAAAAGDRLDDHGRSRCAGRPGVEAIGTVSAVQGVDLTVETSGIVKEILFKANDRVDAGAVLLQLDDDVERADLEAQKAQTSLAQLALNRALELQKRGVGTDVNLDTAQAASRGGRRASGQAAGGAGPEAADGAVRGHGRHPADRGRPVRDARHGRGDPAGPGHDAGRLHRPRAAARRS